MNKPDLIAAVAQNAGLTKRDAERAINAMLDAMTEALSKGERVQLSGFGVFEVRQRAAKVGRDLHTKESIAIPATQVPGFKPSKALRDTVARKERSS